MQSVLSPDVETFSTPPSTPIHAESEIRPSLSRRSSRPSSLRLQQNAAEWKPHVIVEESNGQPSPDLPQTNGASRSGVKNPTPSTATQNGFASANGLNGIHSASGIANSIAHTNGDQGLNAVGVGIPLSSPMPLAPMSEPPPVTSPGPTNLQPRTPRSQAMASPCFLHSRLQDPSMNRWSDQNEPVVQDARVGRAAKPMLEYPNGSATPNGGSNVEGYGFWHDEDGSAGSVTKQLAETAVGVREMSKQLGESDWHSHVLLLISSNVRSYPCPFCHSIRSYRHKGERQQAH